MPINDFSNLPQFITADAAAIIADMNSYYEGLVGKPLLPAQTEAILIKVFAYREKTMRDDFNDGARQMLVDFSTAPLLDYIVALVGVQRLGSQYAKTTLTFSLVEGHAGVTIPALNRTQSSDGKAVFQTDNDTFVPAGTYTVDVPATATVPGTAANGYAVGLVNSILDPLSFVVSAINSTITDAGSDPESDAQLAARAKLAPAAFSNAGSYQAYKFWALTASPLIQDVAVLGPGDPGSPALPGQVYLYPLIPGEVTGADVLAGVLAACSADLRRPLCDQVFALSPTAIPWNVVINLTLYKSVPNHDATVDDISQRTNDYAQTRKFQMGQDVTIDQLKGIALRDTLSVFKADILINGVAADLVVNGTSYANIGTISINVIAFTNG